MNITYKDSEGKELKYFTQWDNNRVIELDGITGNNVMIHFYNKLSSRALVVQPKKQLEKYVVNVPNILLQEPCDIMVAVFVENGEEGKTEEIFSIPVEAKTKPLDYEYKEDKDYINWVELDTLAKEKYKEMQNVVDDINNKLESGAFKGEKGDKGDTPVRGVDYWTIEDKNEVVNETKELVIPLIETDCGNKVTLKLDPKTYVMTLELLTKKNKLLSTANVDLPLETMVINARYEDTTKELIIELKNGEEVKIPIGSIVNGLVDETTFNNKVTDLQNQITANSDELNQVVGEVSDAKQDIGNLKQEQVLQNKAIQKNVDDIIDTNKNVARNTKRIKTLETNIFDSGEAEGESLNINDTALAEFKEIGMQINKAQETTKGINKFPFELIKQTAEVTVNNNEIHVKATPKNPYFFILDPIAWDKFDIFKEKITYFSISKPLNYDIRVVFYSSEGASIIKISKGKTDYNTTIPNKNFDRIGLNLENITPNQPIDITFKMQLAIEKAEIEDYTGGIPAPNPNHIRDIVKISNNFEFTSTGKNLLNPEKIVKDSNKPTVYYENGLIHYRGDLFSLVINPPLNANLEYTYKLKIKNLETTKSANCGFAERYNNGEYKTLIRYTMQPNEEKEIIFKTSKRNDIVEVNSGYFTPANLAIVVEGSMILTGDYTNKVVPYEPYKAITNTINLAGNEFLPGDRYVIKFNEEDGKYWKYLEKNSKKIVLTGNENIQKDVANPYNRYYIKTLDLKTTPQGRINVVSNYFKFSKDNNVGTIFGFNNTQTPAYNNSIFIYPTQELNTIDLLKEWFKAHNTTIVYPLDKQELIPIEPVNIMNMTYYPTTNAFTSIDNIFLKVKYYRDFVNTIRNMQIDNGTLKAQLQDIEKRLQAVETRPTTVEEVIPNA